MNAKNKPELRERLAAEYALGTLRGRARSRLRRWMDDDAALARAVGEWEARLMPLAETLPPVRVPGRVWREVESRLGAGARTGFWDRVAFWRPVGILATGAMAALLAAIVLVPAVKPTPEVDTVPEAYIAVLSDAKTQRPMLIATAARHDARLSVKALDPAILVSGGSLELWAVPRQGAPRSLGLLETAHATLKLVANADRTLGEIPLLAVSLEPRGGSRTGAPTGPVLYSGPCVKYW